MAKNLTHKEWITNEFKSKNLLPSLRNSLIHFSFIESIIMYKADKSCNNFSNAIKFLLCASVISRDEFCLLDKIANHRNTLVHRIIRNHLDQNKIDKRRDDLIYLIKRVYKEVGFIKEYLKDYYGIDTIKN